MEARRPPGLWAFVPLAAAAHLAAFALWPQGLAGGPEGAGEGGFDTVSLAGADGALTDLVAKWESPPEVAPEPALPLAPPVPEVAPPPAPEAPTATLAAPTLALPPTVPDAPPLPVAAPEAPPQPKAAPKPAPKPAPKAPKPARPAASAPQLRAAGEGGGAVAGKNGTAAEGSLTPGAERSALKEWGGKIRAKVERNRRQPAGGGSGRVVLALSVARDGRLISVGIGQSSGNAALDGAALQAARAAGRFPAAPKTLTAPSYAFTLPLLFKR